jgi:hypothetical protein
MQVGAEGANVGTRVLDGCRVGDSDGTTVGENVGLGDGGAVGDHVGASVGLTLGAKDG